MGAKWTHAFDDLLRELRGQRGRPALISGPTDAGDHLIALLRPLVRSTVSLGQRVLEMDHPPSAADLLDGLTIVESVLLIEIEVMFTPSLQLDVMSQLRRISQSTALLVRWPGRITAGRLSYSRPGRDDYLDEPARDMVVMRPISTEFPDDVPYTLERYPG